MQICSIVSNIIEASLPKNFDKSLGFHAPGQICYFVRSEYSVEKTQVVRNGGYHALVASRSQIDLATQRFRLTNFAQDCVIKGKKLGCNVGIRR